MDAHQVFTIGHSTLAVGDFLAALKANNVTAVADVRSAPYSRFNPSFNREALKVELQKHGISYVFLGKELGGRPSDPTCYENGRASYLKMAQATVFKEGLERIVQGSASRRIALMCSEGDPLNCHRTLLVARALTERGIPVVHIGRKGDQEAHGAAEDRLIRLVGLTEDLLHGRDELLAEAYIVQAKRVAYEERSGDAPADAEAV